METRCNYVATIPPLFVVKILIDVLYFRSNYKTRAYTKDETYMHTYSVSEYDVYRKIGWAALVVPTVALSAADDAMTYFSLWPRNWQNWFTVGIAAGHLARIVLGFYFFGLVLYVNYFELIIDVVNNVF